MALFGSTSKANLLYLQKLLVQNSPNKLVFSEKQLMNMANARAQNGLRILNESISIVRKTHDKDVFFSRLGIIDKTLNELICLEPYVKFSGTTPTAIKRAFDTERPGIVARFNYSSFAVYNRNAEKIESQWSIINNMKLYDGPEADAFIDLCKGNMEEFDKMVSFEKTKSQRYTAPTKVPAYFRLAMLYEKRKDYDSAIDICVAAIKVGAIDDGTKGKMYGRLAKMIGKTASQVSDEVKALAASQLQN